MEIIRVVPRGYCQGVVRAIRIAEETVANNPHTTISMLGMIVHNKYVVESCERLGIHAYDDSFKTRLELLDEIQEGIVIFTAHGVSDDVYSKAKDKGLKIVDATCQDVKKTHDLVREHTKHGDVIYIGKHHHPEAEGVVGISKRVHLVSNLEDLKKLGELKDILITTQTTLSTLDTASLIEACKEKYPSAIVSEEICNATTIRQKAVLNLKDVDTLFVVGDPHSNNSNQLKRIGEKHGIPNCYLIETVDDIQESMLENQNRIAVTSGSSTPTYLTNEVIDYLDAYAAKKNR